MTSEEKANASKILVEVSPGELIDKIAILVIKSERIVDADKLRNVHVELALLQTASDRNIPKTREVETLSGRLKEVNEQLWDIEDEIRCCERDKNFGQRFVELARSVYHVNDERARLKREVNTLMGSVIVEEKQYQRYQ